MTRRRNAMRRPASLSSSHRICNPTRLVFIAMSLFIVGVFLAKDQSLEPAILKEDAKVGLHLMKFRRSSEALARESAYGSTIPSIPSPSLISADSVTVDRFLTESHFSKSKSDASAKYKEANDSRQKTVEAE